jgi:hypothetical protein
MTTSTRSAALERLLERHRIEAERIRAERGDPDTWVGDVVRGLFDAESLESAFQELIRPAPLFDNDECDER